VNSIGDRVRPAPCVVRNLRVARLRLHPKHRTVAGAGTSAGPSKCTPSHEASPATVRPTAKSAETLAPRAPDDAADTAQSFVLSEGAGEDNDPSLSAHVNLHAVTPR